MKFFIKGGVYVAEYKRKKVKKSLSREKNRVSNKSVVTTVNKRNKNIGIVPEDSIKVVKGSKFKRKEQLKLFSLVIIVVFLVLFLLSAVTPGSLYENAVKFVATMGHGSYPVDISGGTVLKSVSNDSHYYVLTDTNITAYSNNGKILFNELHGFSNPIISTTSTRALVYDQGGKSVNIYNLKGSIYTLQTEKEIITASISQNGDFAIATHSDSYASVATVYNSNFKVVYTWNSAKDIVNNVLVNPKGDMLAVSTINAVSGQYSSKISILDFESADPLHTLDLGNSLPLTIENTAKGISIICDNKYKFLNWSKFTTSEILVSGEINSFRNSKNGLLLMVNRANDRSDNTIVLVSKKGEKISEFKINNLITDIQYNKGRVYTVSDTEINIYDKDGNVLKTGTCDYGTQKINIIAPNFVSAISDSEIVKINIDEGDK